jgi:hypothetical protein
MITNEQRTALINAVDICTKAGYTGTATDLEALLELSPAATPAAQWRENGEPDPHGDRYACERAALALGSLTDDEVANGVFMHGNTPLDINRVIAKDPKYHAPIVWLTAAKDRIRWLSRTLVKATTPAPAPDAEPAGWRHSLTHCLSETEADVSLADGDERAEPLYTMDQMRDYALAFHKSRMVASGDEANRQGIFSPFNACMYRDESRARAAIASQSAKEPR